MLSGWVCWRNLRTGRASALHGSTGKRTFCGAPFPREARGQARARKRRSYSWTINPSDFEGTVCPACLRALEADKRLKRFLPRTDGEAASRRHRARPNIGASTAPLVTGPEAISLDGAAVWCRCGRWAWPPRCEACGSEIGEHDTGPSASG